jgi:hypothetical protein
MIASIRFFDPFGIIGHGAFRFRGWRCAYPAIVLISLRDEKTEPILSRYARIWLCIRRFEAFVTSKRLLS